MEVKYAERLQRIPQYLFAELERLTAEKKKAGVDVISFGIGDPDIPTPRFILKVLAQEAKNPNNHNYPSSQGEQDFREAVARWYKTRFNVDLDPARQVCNLIGSKEGIANIGRAFVNPGDRVLVPDPAYPVYANGSTILNDGVPVIMPLLEENDFLPDFDAIDKEEVKKAKMIFLNYPNNPTGAVCDKQFLKTAADFCEENNLILCYDNAYSEFTFDNYVAPSIFEVTSNAIEFHSCSKTFCMTGDRCGFAIGDEEIVTGLKKVKPNVDSGLPVYIQKAGIAALNSYTSAEKLREVKKIMREYQRRRNELIKCLEAIGLKCRKPKATFYIWLKIPGEDSIAFAKKALDVGVVVTPGVGFGKYGEGYIRFALTQPRERIKEAVERLHEIM